MFRACSVDLAYFDKSVRRPSCLYTQTGASQSNNNNSSQHSGSLPEVGQELLDANNDDWLGNVNNGARHGAEPLDEFEAMSRANGQAQALPTSLDSCRDCSSYISAQESARIINNPISHRRTKLTRSSNYCDDQEPATIGEPATSNSWTLARLADSILGKPTTIAKLMFAETNNSILSLMLKLCLFILTLNVILLLTNNCAHFLKSLLTFAADSRGAPGQSPQLQHEQRASD